MSGGIQQDVKAPMKRPPNTDTDELVAKKKKKSSSEFLFKSFSSASAHPLLSEKKLNDRPQVKMIKIPTENEVIEKKKPSLPPFEDIVNPNYSAVEDDISTKSEVGAHLRLEWQRSIYG